MASTIGALDVALTANTAAFVAGTQRARNELRSFSAQTNTLLGAVDRSFTRTTAGVAAMVRQTFSLRGAMGALGVSFGAAAIVAFARNVQQATASLTEQAQQAGVGVEALQAYRLILEENGSKAEVMDRALARLTDRLGEAKSGAKEAREAFAAAGISIDSLIRMDTAEAMQAVAIAVLRFGDEAERAAKLNNILGEKIGRFLIPALNDLSQSVDGAIKKYDEFGRIISSKTAAEADANMDRLAMRWRELQAEVAPAINVLYGWFAAAVEGVTAFSEATTIAIRKIHEEYKPPPEAARVFGQRSGMDAMGKPAVVPGGGAGLEAIPDSIAVTPARRSGLADIMAGDDTIRASMQDFQVGLAKQQSEAIKKIWEDESEWRSQRLEESIERQNAASQAIVAIEEATAADVQDLWDGYAEHRARMAKEISDQQVAGADRLRMSLIEVGTAGLYGFRSLGEAAARFLEQMAVMIFQAQVLKPILESIGGKVGTAGGGGVFGTIAAALGGALTGGGLTSGAGTWGGPQAAGGPVSGGTSYLVGERGPELFTPRSSGTISPNGSFGGGVTINVDARGSNLTAEHVKRAVMAGYQASVSTSLDSVAKHSRNTGRR